MNPIDWYQGLDANARFAVFIVLCIGIPALLGIALAGRIKEAARTLLDDEPHEKLDQGEPTHRSDYDTTGKLLYSGGIVPGPQPTPEELAAMLKGGGTEEVIPFRTNRVPRIHRARPLAADDPRGARPHPASIHRLATFGERYGTPNGRIGERVVEHVSTTGPGRTVTGRVTVSEPNRQFYDDPERETELSRTGRDIGPRVAGVRIGDWRPTRTDADAEPAPRDDQRTARDGAAWLDLGTTDGDLQAVQSWTRDTPGATTSRGAETNCGGDRAPAADSVESSGSSISICGNGDD